VGFSFVWVLVYLILHPKESKVKAVKDYT